MKAYKFPGAKPHKWQIAVIGAGNGLDSARCALRLGSEVTLVYRRAEAQIPARIEEIENAGKKGEA